MQKELSPSRPSVSRRLNSARSRAALSKAALLLTGLTLALSACGQQSSPETSSTEAAAPTSAADQGAGLESLSLNRPVDLGPNVKIFDPSMPTEEIQAAADAIYTEQVANQFGPQRYTLFFKPGVYGSTEKPLIVKVGYYTEVAGLGASPKDVTINGHVDVYNQCGPNPADPSQTQCIALNNFWRSLSNLTINVKGLDGCASSANFWAVSQAAPMRRVNIASGNLSLMDYCSAGPQYASGGFIADSKAVATVVNGSQQQFLVRNSSVGTWTNGVWNQVFAGVVGAPAQSFGGTTADDKPEQPYTTLATNPISREKPYLYLDAAGLYRVFVPATQTNSSGVTWESGKEAGRSLPIREFFIARPTDSASAINRQLARGKNLIFTPGIYAIDQTLRVREENTVVLGLGVATLIPQNGVIPMVVSSEARGSSVAGLMFDAGPVNSPLLLQIGNKRGRGYGYGSDEGERWGKSSPIALQDVFFRVGGAQVGKASLSLEVNSDNTILDHLWAWRADHGNVAGDTGWTINPADTGVVINGNNVTATGMFVEHYQKTQLIWNGQNGKTIMFQNEMPYDAPNQAAWQNGAALGYPAYKVADSVKTHEAWGLGSYIYTNVDPTIHATRGFEVPVTAGVKMHNLLTVQLGAGTLDHVINDTGAAVTSAAIGVPSNVVNFP
jgi:hypothetical protein